MGCHYSKTAVVELTSDVSEANVDAENEPVVQEFNSSNKTNKKRQRPLAAKGKRSIQSVLGIDYCLPGEIKGNRPLHFGVQWRSAYYVKTPGRTHQNTENCKNLGNCH